MTEGFNRFQAEFADELDALLSSIFSSAVLGKTSSRKGHLC